MCDAGYTRNIGGFTRPYPAVRAGEIISDDGIRCRLREDGFGIVGHAKVSGGKGALLAAVFITFTLCPSLQSQHLQAQSGQFQSVKDYGAKGDGVTDDAAAIQAAINATRTGSYSSGCVFLPPGRYMVRSTLSFLDFEGLTLIGAGSGENASAGAAVILWGGPSNGTVVDIRGCIGCSFRGFIIEGNHTAGIGLSYGTAWVSGGRHLVSAQSKFSEIAISNVLGSPGRALYVGSPGNAQVSESSFDRFHITDAVAAIYQEGGNTLNIHYRDFLVSWFTLVGMDVECCSFLSEGNTFTGAQTGATATYLIRNSSFGTIIGDYDEHNTPVPVFSFPGVANVPGSGPITIIGSSFGISRPNVNVLNWTRNGSLELIGTKFQGLSGGNDTATFAPLGVARYGETGTLYEFGSRWINITISASGSFAVESNQSTQYNVHANALKPFASNHNKVFDQTNVQFIKSPLSFYDGTTRYNMHADSGGLNFLNASGGIVGGWNTGAPTSPAIWAATSLQSNSVVTFGTNEGLSLTTQGKGHVTANSSFAGGLSTAPFSPTPSFDGTYAIQRITLTGDVPSSTLFNCVAGETIVFDIIEDNNGGHAFTWPANVHGGGAITTTPGYHNRQQFYCDGTNAWSLGSLQSGR